MRDTPPGPQSPQREPSAWRTLGLPCAMLLVAMLNLTLIVAGLKELIIDELGGGTREASLFFSIEMAAYILLAPLWGLVSDRLGKRKILVICGFLATAPLYALFATLDSLPWLLLLRFVQGGVTVLAWSTLMAMVLDHPDDSRRGLHSGMMGGSISLGVSLGAPLGGFITRAYGPRAPLEVAAVLFLLLGLFALGLHERRSLRRRGTLKEIAGALGRQPKLAWPFAFYFVDRYTVGFLVVLFPLYLASQGAADPAARGQYLALFLLPFALLQLPAGKLMDRVGPTAPLLGGSLLYGVGLCTLGFAGMDQLWWLMLILGSLAAVMFPPAIFLVARWSTPETRGSAVGGFNLAGSLGFAIGPLVGEWAQGHWGYRGAFVVGGTLEIVIVLIALTTLGLHWLLKRRREA